MSQFPLQSVCLIRKLHKPIHQRADRMKTSHTKLTKLITWTTALSNSVKLWAVPCRDAQDRWIRVENSDKTWSTGEGNGKPLQYSCLENPMNSMTRQKERTLKDELPRSVGAQYASVEEWRNNSRKNEATYRKQEKAKTVSSCGCDWWWKSSLML